MYVRSESAVVRHATHATRKDIPAFYFLRNFSADHHVTKGNMGLVSVVLSTCQTSTTLSSYRLPSTPCAGVQLGFTPSATRMLAVNVVGFHVEPRFPPLGYVGKNAFFGVGTPTRGGPSFFDVDHVIP